MGSHTDTEMIEQSLKTLEGVTSHLNSCSDIIVYSHRKALDLDDAHLEAYCETASDRMKSMPSRNKEKKWLSDQAAEALKEYKPLLDLKERFTPEQAERIQDCIGDLRFLSDVVGKVEGIIKEWMIPDWSDEEDQMDWDVGPEA
ncbi:MAG: hypothetical protein Q9159_005511 [Coniocarpon cinnabarinum]